MKSLLNKILFCFNITAGIPSFVRLLLNSKKLSRSKSITAKPHDTGIVFPLNIHFENVMKTIFLRTYEGDIDIFFEIFHKRIYELPTGLFDKTKLIVDLGSNIGLSALYFTGKCPHAKIFCVEPGAANFKMLLQNLASEISTGKIVALNAAAMGIDGMVAFSEQVMQYNSKVTEEEQKSTKAVSVSTLLQMNGIHHVEIMKIDIEGAEKHVFSGDMEWLNITENILIEMHSEEDYRICIDVLRRHNFIIKQVNAFPDNQHLYWAKKAS